MRIPMLLLCTGLLAADPLPSLARFQGTSPLKKTFHVKGTTDHPSRPKEPAQERQAEVALTSQEGNVTMDSAPGGLGNVDPSTLLDAQKLVRGWFSAAPGEAVQGAGSVILQLPPRIPVHLKRLWAVSGQVELWIAVDGTPARAHLVQAFQGRYQRIAPTEEVKEVIDFDFKPDGDHLLVTRREERREESIGYDRHRFHSLIELGK